MAALISPQLGDGTPSATAGRVREEFESWKLDDYTLVAADFEAAAVCEIDVDLMINGEKKPARMRWIREDAEGRPATPNEPGTWYLYLWGPLAMLNRRDVAED
jgi:hypothetical protein